MQETTSKTKVDALLETLDVGALNLTLVGIDLNTDGYFSLRFKHEGFTYGMNSTKTYGACDENGKGEPVIGGVIGVFGMVGHSTETGEIHARLEGRKVTAECIVKGRRLRAYVTAHNMSVQLTVTPAQ